MTALVTGGKGDRVTTSGHGDLLDEHGNTNAPTETDSGQKPLTGHAESGSGEDSNGHKTAIGHAGTPSKSKHEIDSGQKTAGDHDVTAHGKIVIETSNDHKVLDGLTANRKQSENASGEIGHTGYNFRFLMYKTGTARMARQGMEGKICRAPKAQGV